MPKMSRNVRQRCGCFLRGRMERADVGGRCGRSPSLRAAFGEFPRSNRDRMTFPKTTPSQCRGSLQRSPRDSIAAICCTRSFFDYENCMLPDLLHFLAYIFDALKSSLIHITVYSVTCLCCCILIWSGEVN